MMLAVGLKQKSTDGTRVEPFRHFQNAIDWAEC